MNGEEDTTDYRYYSKKMHISNTEWTMIVQWPNVGENCLKNIQTVKTVLAILKSEGVDCANID